MAKTRKTKKTERTNVNYFKGVVTFLLVVLILVFVFLLVGVGVHTSLIEIPSSIFAVILALLAILILISLGLLFPFKYSLLNINYSTDIIKTELKYFFNKYTLVIIISILLLVLIFWGLGLVK